MDQLDFFGQEPGADEESADFHGEEPTTISRRVRTLLLTGPIHALHRNKAHRPELRDLDVRTLALVALDFAIEGMGLDSGISRRELVGKLATMAPLFIGTSATDGFRAACEYVVDGLLNAPRSEVFREEYLAIHESPAVNREFEFRLLQEEEREGQVVLRASTFGINLYLRMLDTEVEDAQVANEAMLADQLHRGAIDRAAQSAHQAKLLSMSLEEKIETMLRRLSRDIRQVDFAKDLKPELEQARQHLERRTSRSADLLEAVEERLDEARGDAARALARLRDTLEDCRARHDRLAQRVISATRTFLDEQARQSFRRARNWSIPSMDSDVLRRALRENSGAIAEMSGEIVALFHAPESPSVLSFAGLIDSCFAPKRLQSTMQAELDDSAPVAVAAPPERWPSAECEALFQWLADTVAGGGEAGVALSELLIRADAEGFTPSQRHLLVLEAMRLLEVHESERGLKAEALGMHFATDWFAGDDLNIRSTEAV